MDVEENAFDVLTGAMETIIRSTYTKILIVLNPTDLTRQHALFEYITNILNYRIINIGGYSNMYLAEK
jgi:hypothetical protein